MDAIHSHPIRSPPPAGDTIYNLSRFNELEAGDDDRPEHPPVLLRAEVLWNPFDDLQPRVDRWALVWVPVSGRG